MSGGDRGTEVPRREIGCVWIQIALNDGQRHRLVQMGRKKILKRILRVEAVVVRTYLIEHVRPKSVDRAEIILRGTHVMIPSISQMTADGCWGTGRCGVRIGARRS